MYGPKVPGSQTIRILSTTRDLRSVAADAAPEHLRDHRAPRPTLVCGPSADVTFDPAEEFVTPEDADMAEILIAPEPPDLDATPDGPRAIVVRVDGSDSSVAAHPVLVMHGR